MKTEEQPMTDADLVRQTLAGHGETYTELVQRWVGRVTALCHAKVGCAAAADDIAQDSLLKGYQMLSTLTNPDKFGPWLCRIATNGCLNWLKARERSAVPFSALSTEKDPEQFLSSQPGYEAAESDR